MSKSNFSEFTSLYEISKTLRFELKPVGITGRLLEENHVFPKDKIVYESYKKIRPYLDKLHIKFIEESFGYIKLDLEEIEKTFIENTKKSKNELTKQEKDNFDKLKTVLRKDVVKGFNNNGDNWINILKNKISIDDKGKEKEFKIKGDGYKILLSDTNLDILAEIFTEEKEGDSILIEKYVLNPDFKEGNLEKRFILEKQNLFKSFKGFTTYFTNFNHSRENFYKEDGKTGRIATRIIDENLLFFLKNKNIFDEKYKNNLEIVSKFNEKLYNFGEEIGKIFSLEFYNKCFSGKQIEYYNKLIGELNSVINLEKQAKFSYYNQLKKEGKEQDKFNKYNFPIFKELYKQILSDKTEEQKFIEIENFDDVKNYLNELIKINNEKYIIANSLINSFIVKFEEYDFEKIYISKLSLNTLSAKLFGSGKWQFIEENLLNNIGKKNLNGKKDLPDFIKLIDIKNSLENINKVFLEDNNDKEDFFKEDFVFIKEENIFKKFLKILKSEFENLYNGKNNKDGTYQILGYAKTIEELKNNILDLNDFSENKEEKEQQIVYIKNYLDSSLNIYRMMKYFSLEKGKENEESKYETDDNFYNEFKKFYIDNELIKYYNEFRNYLSKKPYSTNKIKLNFENGTLIDGWDKNKEPDNFGTLLKKDGKYFLVLQIYGKKNVFYKKKGSGVEDIKEAFIIVEGEDIFEKIDYKFLPDPKKMLPKVFFAKTNLDLFNPSEEILKIKKDETFKIGEKFNKQDFEKIVDFYKESIIKYPDWKIFNFNFSDTKNYNNLSDFYKEVELGSYNLTFRYISEKYILKNIEEKNIYLFEIYNKDFSEHKTGKDNLHTIYFKGLFEKINLENIVLKLNGQAEIFRRESSIKEKKDNRAKNNLEKSHEIIEKERYTKDKLFFHCPIKLNFARHDEKINQKILEYISKDKEINIIGIDRGEKHLAYYSVINRKGEIIKDKNGNLVKGSLNVVGNNQNYHDKLKTREEERQKARGSWTAIGNIKDLKQGYISQVVHKLAELVIEHNAIIIFEDLNSGFKRGRQKIERQVYQKLEKALIEKGSEPSLVE